MSQEVSDSPPPGNDFKAKLLASFALHCASRGAGFGANIVQGATILARGSKCQRKSVRRKFARTNALQQRLNSAGRAIPFPIVLPVTKIEARERIVWTGGVHGGAGREFGRIGR